MCETYLSHWILIGKLRISFHSEVLEIKILNNEYLRIWGRYLLCVLL